LPFVPKRHKGFFYKHLGKLWPVCQDEAVALVRELAGLAPVQAESQN
jgi:hypothetical protein